jgi:glycosyl transferase family 25
MPFTELAGVDGVPSSMSEKPNASGDALLRVTGPLRIVNLPHRSDRRADLAAQLRRVGLSFDHPMVSIFPAIRPSHDGGFPSIGARGCFLSHLEILKQALAEGWDGVCICEDDLDFSSDIDARLPEITSLLSTSSWSIFYGGYGDTPMGSEIAPGLCRIDPGQALTCTHLYAVRRSAIVELVPYLEAMLRRPDGHADGGLMHYDGALSWFRNAHPQHITLAACPAIGVQRPSRTDIHALRWFDRLPVLRALATIARRARNGYQSR